jgi:hypothetical protein
MSIDDLLTNPDDRIETEPPELRLPWSAAQETKLQEAIAELAAAANARGLSTFNIVVVRRTGQRVVRSLDVARITKE